MSSEQKSEGSNKVYYSVFDQKFRTRVPEGFPDAISRINKLNKQVYEREVSALFGTIEGVTIEDSEYGKQIKITLDPNEDGKSPVVTFGAESKNGRDVLKLLPAVDFSNEVRIFPYRFIPEDKDEEITGISFANKDAEGKFTLKVGNHFYDPATKTYLHGYPVIAWDKASESEQKIYKIQRDEFLLKYLQEQVIPAFSEKPVHKNDFKGFEYPSDEINVDDVPF